MSNERKIYSTGGGNATIGDMLLERQVENLLRVSQKVGKDAMTAAGTKAPATETPAAALPDLNTIEVGPVEIPTLDASVREKIAGEAEATKQWAEAAGSKLAQLEDNLEKIRVEISKIERLPASALSSTAKNLLTQLKEAERQELAKRDSLLGAGDDALKAHVEFSRLLEEIRSTDPSHLGEVRTLIGRVVKIGRYRLATEAEIKAAKAPGGKWPLGTIFFEGKIYFSFSEKSSGQKALEAELRKLVDAAKFSKAASIKDRGNADLTDFPKGKPGKYYFFGQKRTKKNKSGEEYKVGEGHALIEIVNINEGKMFYDKDKGKKILAKPFMAVYVRDAIGSLAKWLEKKERYIPFIWIEQKKVITSYDNRLPKDEFDRALNIIWTLRELYEIWNKGLNPATEEPAAPEEKSEDGPSYTVPPDNSDVVVEKVATATPVVPTADTTPLLPAMAEKKVRKTKKTADKTE